MTMRYGGLVLALLLSACGHGELEPGDEANVEFSASSAPSTETVTGDRPFARGFHVYSPDLTNGAKITHRLVPPNAPGAPVWQLAQWHSKGTLVGAGKASHGGWTWASKYKRVTVAPGTLDLAVNSNAEFGGIYRKAGQHWPHLLVQQRLSSSPLSQAAQLKFSMQTRVVYSQVIKKTGYNRNLHASKYRLNFTINNRNRQSAGYGDFFWLIVPVYDDREAFPGHGTHKSVDVGAGRLMYSVPYRDLCATSAQSKTTVTLAGDLLPHVRRALADGYARGQLKSNRLADYSVGNVNLGMEMPGLGTLVVRSQTPSLRFIRK